jgi:hypothetical protein
MRFSESKAITDSEFDGQARHDTQKPGGGGPPLLLRMAMPTANVPTIKTTTSPIMSRMFVGSD